MSDFKLHSSVQGLGAELDVFVADVVSRLEAIEAKLGIDQTEDASSDQGASDSTDAADDASSASSDAASENTDASADASSDQGEAAGASA